MHFDSPLWLAGLPLVVLWTVGSAFALIRNHRHRQARFHVAARPGALPRAGTVMPKLVSLILLALAAGALAVAIARPQGAPAAATSTRRGVNLVILVDGSTSMSCEDLLPSRQQAARLAVEALARGTVGSRYALFMFGGAPTLLIPRTFDAAAVTLAARSISPDYVGKGGTALTPALQRAAAYLQQGAGAQPKVIVVISDGEEGEGDPVLTAMQLHTEQNIRIHTITVGTASGGPMPLYKKNPRGERVRVGDWLDGAQKPYATRAQPELMAKLAESGGGKSIQLIGGEIAPQLQGLIERDIMAAAVPIDDLLTEQPREWFWVPLLLAVLLLIGEQAFRHRLARRQALQPGLLPRSSVLLRETPKRS